MKFARSIRRSAAIAWLQRAVVYATVGWIVTEGDLSGWMFLLPILAGVATVDAMLAGWRPWRIRAVPAARFATFFVWQSVRGGIDVALRAMHPRLPIAPTMTEFSLRLATPSARVLFANAVSLLPGTLAVNLFDERLQLHVLDANAAIGPTLRELEERIAALHGETLNAGADGS
jgi:multicomponent Na+:H+ antiporter subunit E